MFDMVPKTLLMVQWKDCSFTKIAIQLGCYFWNFPNFSEIAMLQKPIFQDRIRYLFVKESPL